MRRRIGFGLGLALLLAIGCGGDDDGGGAPGEAWITDAVLAPRPEREASRPPPSPTDPAPDTTTPAARPADAPEPGSVEVALGEPAEGPPLDAVPWARSVGTIGMLEYRHLGRRGGTQPRAPGIHVVLDAPYQSWAGDGTFVHALAMNDALEPLPAADVYLGRELVGRTDAHGAIAFRRTPAPGEDTSNGVLTVKHGELTRSIAYSAFTRTESFEGKTVYVYSDRGVYQPGQTIHVRAIGWRLRGEYAPLAQERIELQLLDGEGRVVHGGVIDTDRFGTGTFDIPLPEHVEEGRYQLAALIGEERAEADLRIERFVTPVISIEHDLPRFVTPDVPRLDYHLTLGYLGGGTFREADVAVRLEVGGRVIEALPTRHLTGPGPHDMAIPEGALAAARTASRRGGRIDVVLKVTDADGREDEVRRMLRYEQVPYRVVVELDRTRYAPRDPVQANVRVVDLDAVPVRGKGVALALEGRRMRAVTDESGIAAFRFPAPPRVGGYVGLTAYVDDVREPVARSSVSVQEPLPMRSSVPETVVQEETDLAVEIAFPTGTVPAEQVVHADLVDSSGAIIHSALVPVVGDVARGTIRTPSWGSVLLTLWCLGRRGDEVGLMTDGQNLTVTPNRTLSVTLDGLPEQVAPGEDVDVQVSVRGPDGAVREAVASVAVVDRGVITMLDPLERAPVDRFYNPERKVLASTGAQTLTWPVVQRTWGPDRYDIGWPYQFGWHRGAPPPVAVPPEVLELLSRPGGPGGGGSDGAGALGALMGMGGAWNSPTSPYGADTAVGQDPMSALGALMGDQIGENFGFGGLGLTGTGVGGGGTGEGTIGIGNLGTIGHGAGGGTGSGYGRGAGGMAGRGRSAPAAPIVDEAAPVTLVVRTDFAETSGWWPSVAVDAGGARFTAKLPDAITEQDIAVVVSDAEGGVGVGRARVPVRQPLYARSDLPATLVAGDRVAVRVAARNLSGAPQRVRLSLESSDLAVSGEPQEVDVAPDATGVARFEVTAARPGDARYRVVAESLSVVEGGRRLRDEEARTLFVRPAGTATRVEHAGVAKADDPYRHTFTLDAGDRYQVVRLGVSLPTVVPALEDVVSMATEGYYGTEPAASRTLAAAAAVEYLRRRGTDEARQERLVAFLGRVAAGLAMAQNEDGGWGGYARVETQLHTTAFALESLVSLTRAGQHVPREVIDRGARRLAGLVGGDAVDVSDVAPWEGDSEGVRRAVLAQAFHVLAQVERDQPGTVDAAVMVGLAGTLVPLLDGADTTPLVLARTALGLVEVSRWEAIPSELVEARVKAEGAARRLADVGRVLYWEPGWFEAYGGRIEAAYAALLLLDELDDDRWESARREAVRFLLSTRTSWGRWHNARSAAFAVRALLLLEPAPEGDRGTVVVSLDGREVRRVDVSDRDLYATALALREVELPAGPGEHTVEVTYDGGLRARVDLEIERWGAPGAGSAPERPAGARDVTVARELPATTRVGASVYASLVVRSGAEAGPVLVSQPLSPALDVARDDLVRLRAGGRILDFSLGADAVHLVLAPASETRLDLPMRAGRAGEVTLAPVEVRSLAHGDARAESGASTIRIEG